jgi:hypothetical protein
MTTQTKLEQLMSTIKEIKAIEDSSTEGENFEVVPTAQKLPTANGELEPLEYKPMKLPTYKSSYQALKKLKAIHYKIISLHIAGHKNIKIAEMLSVTNHTVGKCLNSPLAQGIIAGHGMDMVGQAATIKEQLEELGGLAVANLEDILLNDPDSGKRMTASKTVLEYIQSKAIQRVEETRVIVTADLVKEMRDRVAATKPTNMVEETTFVEVKDEQSGSEEA